MNQLKRLLAMLLALVMVLGVLPAQVFAEEETAEIPVEIVTEELPEETQPAETQEEGLEEPEMVVDTVAPDEIADVADKNFLETTGEPGSAMPLAQQEYGHYTFYWENPVYADMDFPRMTLPQTSPAISRARYVSVNSAISSLRSSMVHREKQIQVNTYVGNDPNFTDEEFAFYVDYVCLYVFYSALEPTTYGSAGDYLSYHITEAYQDCTYSGEGTDVLYLQINFQINYLTTYEQEQEVDFRLRNWMKEMAIMPEDAKAEYEKICAIYDYITTNVAYDYAAEEDMTDLMAYSAYGAAIEGSALSNGFSSMFYWMALTAGLDARIILGEVNGVEHVWNIVKLGDEYYNIDATRDAILAQAGKPYQYFLKSDTSFAEYTREESYLDPAFCEQYPIAKEDFSFQYLAKGTCGKKLTWVLGMDRVLTISGSGLMYDNDASLAAIANSVERVVIDSGAESIGAAAFKNYINLQSVSFPKTVKSIGEYAFYNCAKLTEIPFVTGSLVESIGGYAFYGCKAITKVSLPSKTKTLGNYVFGFCENLENITFPQSVTEIGEGSFVCCGKLSNVTLPSKLTWVEHYTFNSCTSLKTIEIPNYVGGIGIGAFTGCESLETVKIGTSVDTIGNDAFRNCTALKNVNMGSEVDYIHRGAFYGCTSLESIQFPTAMQHIEESAFENCASLKTVVLTKNMKSVGKRAFAGCTALKSVEIPGAFCRISEEMFSGCTSLETVTFKGSVPDEIRVNAFKDVVATAYYPAGNSSWKAELMQNYGGEITWVSVCSGSHKLVVSVVAPTCTEQGYTLRDCSKCDYAVKDTYVAATGHMYDAVVTPATCTEAGYTTHTCSTCGDSYTDMHEEALGHRYEEIVTPPTCTEAGYTTHTCSNCGDSYVDLEESAIGHDYSSEVTLPTCVEDGYTTYTCGNCGHSYSDDVVEALGHAFADWVDVDGIVQRVCQTEGCGCVEYESGAKNLTTGKLYSDIVLALAEASPGDTVEMLASNDITGTTLVIPAGVTLDLKAYTLTADYLVGLKGSMLTGTAIDKNGENGGKLMVPQKGILLSSTAPDGATAGYKILPVWNGECFIFSQAAILKTDFQVGNDSVRLDFIPNFTGYVKNNLFKTDGCADNDVSIIIAVSWMESGIRVTQEYFYTTSLVIDAMNNKLLFAEMVGCDAKEDLVFRIAIKTDCGVQAVSQDFVY